MHRKQNKIYCSLSTKHFLIPSSAYFRDIILEKVGYVFKIYEEIKTVKFQSQDSLRHLPFSYSEKSISNQLSFTITGKQYFIKSTWNNKVQNQLIYGDALWYDYRMGIKYGKKPTMCVFVVVNCLNIGLLPWCQMSRWYILYSCSPLCKYLSGVWLLVNENSWA